MEDHKDRFGEKLKLVERAKEDIYFAERDRELLEKLRNQLTKSESQQQLKCPKCGGTWESYTFRGLALDRCQNCGGVWLDNGELEGLVRKIGRGPLGEWLDKLAGKTSAARSGS